MSSAQRTYIMEDPREAMRLELKVDAEAWVAKYLAHLLKPGAEVLSVGCGPGMILRQVCAFDHSIRATGIDLSAGRVQEAIQKNTADSRLTFVQGDAHMMPFLPGTFDFVFSLAVIEHLRQPFVAAQEMYDALRNGGGPLADVETLISRR